MSILTFKSPGVSVREIDLSAPSKLSPSGVPAGIVGTAVRGPAFVPITVSDFQDFVSHFGNTDGEKFGPLAAKEWLENARALTYVRVLGVGDGKPRLTTGNNPGTVKYAGFVVGDQLVQANGSLGNNRKGVKAASFLSGSGRTYFLGCFMSDSAGSSYLRDAGIQGKKGTHATRAHPIIRGVVFAPRGVILSLSSSQHDNNTVSSTDGAFGVFGSGTLDAGSPLGDVVLENSEQDFTMLLNGHKISADAENTLNLSFDPKKAHYFPKVLNTDPSKIEEQGHYLYAHFDVDPALAVVTGSGITVVNRTSGTIGGFANGNDGVKRDVIAFMLTGSRKQNEGSATHPNYENFENRFATAFSPFIISQKFGGSNKNLFRFHARDDGAVGGNAFKVSIENVQASYDANSEYGEFDIKVRKFDDPEKETKALETYYGVNLDPSSDKYIARVIGDMNSYYDFDQAASSQKLVVEGGYANRSQYVRVELSDGLNNGSLPASAIPMGFRGLHHLVTSGSTATANNAYLTGGMAHGEQGGLIGITRDELKRTVQPPIPMRDSVSTGKGNTRKAVTYLHWGVQFSVVDDLNERNRNENSANQGNDPSLLSFCRYFPDHQTTNRNVWVGNNEGIADADGTILDADRFNNNLFSLEKVQVITASGDVPDAEEWVGARYRRDGTALATLSDRNAESSTKVRFLDAAKDFTHRQSREYMKFTFPLIGGFDGLNIFDINKSDLTDTAVRREMADTNQGIADGPTVQAYRKAVTVMEDKSDVDIQLLAIPGLRHTAVSDFAIESIERRFDALYIMDIEEQDELGVYLTSSNDTNLAPPNINVSNTATVLSNRALDSSFAAAYFPDVFIKDPNTGVEVQCPPSVAVLGALSLNDELAHPWYAPAGFSRGALPTTVRAHVLLNRNNLDQLYSSDINPLVAFSHTAGTIVFGQKTLLAAQSALDRVNVRRLLIDIRRKVKRIANGLLFEPNRASTLAAFSAEVTPVLNAIQQQQGLDRFKVMIDTSTTTQTDVENNTIRGKIFLQPTRTVEFISLDFVVANAGSDIFTQG